MNAHDETRTLRRRLTGVEQALAARGAPTAVASEALVGRTTAVDTYPTVARAYYAMQPVRITGRIGEGIVPTLTAGGSVFYAMNVGTAIPDEGTDLVVSMAGGRFVFGCNG